MSDRRRSRRRALLKVLASGGALLSGGCASLGADDDTSPGSDDRTRSSETATRTDPTQSTASGGDDRFASRRVSIGLRKVAEGFTSPLQYREPDRDSGRAFVVDQTGHVFVLTEDGVRDEPFLDISDRIVALGENNPHPTEERGLLGFAFHPDYADNRRFFVRYSAPRREGTPPGYSHTEILSEFRAGADFRFADPASSRVLMEFPSPTPIHQAGAITFGPEGYLYVSMGDGGVPVNGQKQAENLLGGILRIDVDSAGRDRPYSVPESNPLVGRPGLDELFAWGLRNPWRMSFDDGDLYVADVGSTLYEEVNVVENGDNYGWPIKEGPQCVEVENLVGRPAECPEDAAVESFRDPIVHYPHVVDGEILGLAIIGGYTYRAETVPALTGNYVFGDYSSSFEQPAGTMFMAEPSEDVPWQITELTVSNSETGALGRSLLSLGRGREGELYVLTSGMPPSESTDFAHRTGEMFKVIPPGETERTIRPRDAH